MHFNVYDKKGEVSENSLEGVQFRKSNAEVYGVEIGTNRSALASDILTKFRVKAEDALHSIRIRIYKEAAPGEYFYNSTLANEFSKGDLKEYAFNKSLEARDGHGNYAAAGEYILEIRVEYALGANKIFKEKFNITVK